MNLHTLTIPTLLLALALSAGCASSDGYFDQAQQEGMSITDPDSVTETVDWVCTNMSEGRAPLQAGSVPPSPDSSSGSGDPMRLLQLGIADRCPEHAPAFAALKTNIDTMISDSERIAANDPYLNVGPDGYCVGTPCGSNGRAPLVDGQPYTP